VYEEGLEVVDGSDKWATIVKEILCNPDRDCCFPGAPNSFRACSVGAGVQADREVLTGK
jgi:hypothetical protein